ncbi:hypothetical protein [Streptomyces corynorhini]|uniref:Glycosyltransferase n=1 Tax=Streptomyces corynorhini TaxID=2282652 RepID=A0A370B2M9_9ACTN|nr:hypothetical protein [Streptomyces corynorhini]RDG33976.1 hypothetical protein DVH02_30785 [Streptomyces corynorhini]
MRPSSAAILPSRDEPETIAAVTAAVDAALDDPHAVIVHADASDHSETAARFTATPTRARKISLTGLPRGKGTQILHALPHLPDPTGALLITDTDTRNPDADLYRALLAHADSGYAIADYPRYWDEGNLTSHLARPLIAATTGHDVPQPLAGDLALCAGIINAVRTADAALPPRLATAVNGYGIDAFLLLTAAAVGPITTVPASCPKQHAASFPHLPQIYDEAVPILLALAANAPAPPAPRTRPPRYRPADRHLTPDQQAFMLTALDRLAPRSSRYDARPWPLPLVDAWHAVKTGVLPNDAARTLRPHYVHRVRLWLTATWTTAERADILTDAHTRLITELADHPVWSHTP